MPATGTIVTFNNVKISKPQLELEIIPFIKEEFCWFLELNKNKGFKIIINDVILDYSELLLDNEEFVIDENNTTFEIKYVQWKKSLNTEQSKFYYINDDNIEVYKDFTTLNRKSDNFYHSIYIKSDFFNNFDFQKKQSESQINLFAKAKSAPEHKQLISKLGEYLQSKRKPFLRAYAEKLINDYETQNIFPEIKNDWEQPRLRELKDTIIGLYEAQPKIFVSLNTEQKKTFVRFLNLLLDSNEREHIFDILEEIVNLDTDEREQLSRLFKTTKLDRVISTIKLIEDRYKTYYALQDLVFKAELEAAEVPHLQSLIENHYWLFGEEYHLVTAAEPKFNEALEKYIYHTKGNKIKADIDHQFKLKEMDIFACRQNKKDNIIQNIMVELKHPLVALGQAEYMQVDKYMSVITSQPQFNASNMEWRFYLIGNKFDTSGFIERQIESNKNHGEASLVLSNNSGKIKFYVKTWRQIFTEFELKHSFIDAKLKLERDELITECNTANALVELANGNSAISPPQVFIPKS
ncbi:ATP-binding protein [Hymenobacter sp. BT491]|uniref:ATP-binding protein n=1 Tax=Hymenobacter sp. BT491 TaxID=2766779 RepID=UPI001653D751|nr:ATP-binding protein [Hymenobacter sp. BT491]MBC6991162.1 ATP-binding protein [Hymenobacter sp. BT491]